MSQLSLALILAVVALTTGKSVQEPKQQPGDYPYDEVIGASILFYEANRCGKLPTNNRIPYRADSFLDDADAGVDLVGGYFDGE
jgi:endoglucanase